MTHLIDVQFASNETEVPDREQFTGWAEAALQYIDIPSELSIRIVDSNEGAYLNEYWRKKTGPTNVLSFPASPDLDLEPRLLGDIVICAPVVNNEAYEQGKDTLDHWAHMVVHGTLHLLGYDHEEGEQKAKVMESLEIEILDSLNIANPYD